MTSPARRHRERHHAAAAAAAPTPALARAAANEYELMLAALDEDRRRLKQVQSVERKIAVKRELLPKYAAWCAGVMQADADRQDDVFMTVLVWQIDVGDFEAVLPMAAHAIKHALKLPDHFERTTACLIAEEVSDTALKALEADAPIAPTLLLETDELTTGQDMPDEVRAKLNKAIAYALLAQPADEQTEGEARLRKEAALERLKRALQLHDRVGVKKDIERLERELKNSAATSG